MPCYPLKLTAICGWAVPPLWFGELIRQQFIGVSVNAIYPQDPQDENEAKSILDKISSDLIIGYSLGSLWLLYHRKFINPKIQIALLAPTLAFPCESMLGGKISKAKLKCLIKVMSRNPYDNSSLFDFYRMFELESPDSLIEEFIDRTVLLRGLNFLNTQRAPTHFGEVHIAIIGENDPFLDPNTLKIYIPNLTILPQTGHHPKPLLKALFDRLKQ
tara:strand:+ start:1199 stop:1846 length:648 start_codon:yes stop_codon:yes gene_type:complete